MLLGEKRRGGPPVRAAAVVEVEDGALTEQRILLLLLASPLRLREDLEHAGARGSGRVERTAAHQRLGGLLVYGAAIDSLAEVPDRGEAAVLLARLEDGVDRRRADV